MTQQVHGSTVLKNSTDSRLTRESWCGILVSFADIFLSESLHIQRKVPEKSNSSRLERRSLI